MRKTVAQLHDEVQEIRQSMSNVQLSRFTVYHWEQVAVELERHSRYGELIEMKITSEHQPSRNIFHLTIWHYPLLNRDNEAKGDYYAYLRKTRDKLS